MLGFLTKISSALALDCEKVTAGKVMFSLQISAWLISTVAYPGKIQFSKVFQDPPLGFKMIPLGSCLKYEYGMRR
jgi:hypothetical protein